MFGSIYNRVCQQYQVYRDMVKSCQNITDSTKARFTVDIGDKRFIFTNNLYIKKGHSVLRFIFIIKWRISMSTILKILESF